MALVKVLAYVVWAVPLCRGKGVPYQVEVLDYKGTVSDRVARIWDGDDDTCFSVHSEVNRTRASVRLFLNHSVPVALSRVVASPQPNVVYYLLEDKNDTIRRPSLDIWKGNIWNYRGEFSARVHAVDIHSVKELCEVTIFAAQNDTGSPDHMAMEQKSGNTQMSPWKLVLYATLPVVVFVVILTLLYLRRKPTCNSGLWKAICPSQRARDTSCVTDVRDNEQHEARQSTDDRTTLFHNQLYVSADWDRPEQRRDSDKSDGLGDPVSESFSDIDFVNRMLETSWEYAEIECKDVVEPL